MTVSAEKFQVDRESLTDQPVEILVAALSVSALSSIVVNMMQFKAVNVIESATGAFSPVSFVDFAPDAISLENVSHSVIGQAGGAHFSPGLGFVRTTPMGFHVPGALGHEQPPAVV